MIYVDVTKDCSNEHKYLDRAGRSVKTIAHSHYKPSIEDGNQFAVGFDAYDNGFYYFMTPIAGRLSCKFEDNGVTFNEMVSLFPSEHEALHAAKDLIATRFKQFNQFTIFKTAVNEGGDLDLINYREVVVNV